jgi:hypothetical protein
MRAPLPVHVTAPRSPPDFSPEELAAIPVTLSADRFGTFVRRANSERMRALRLYMWNAKVSAAFVTPLHLAEITIRNAVAEALERAYATRECITVGRSPPIFETPKEGIARVETWMGR